MNGKKVISSCRDKIEEVVSSLGLTHQESKWNGA